MVKLPIKSLLKNIYTAALVGAAAIAQEYRHVVPTYDTCDIKAIGMSSESNIGRVRAHLPSGEVLSERTIDLSNGKVAIFPRGTFPGATQIVVTTPTTSYATASCQEYIGEDRDRIQTAGYIIPGTEQGTSNTPVLKNASVRIVAREQVKVQGLKDIFSLGAMQSATGEPDADIAIFTPSANVHQKVAGANSIMGVATSKEDYQTIVPHFFKTQPQWSAKLYIQNPNITTATAYIHPMGQGSTYKPIVADLLPRQIITVASESLDEKVQGLTINGDFPLRTWVTYTWQPSAPEDTWTYNSQEIQVPGIARAQQGKKSLVPFVKGVSGSWTAIAIPNYTNAPMNATIDVKDADGNTVATATTQIPALSTLAKVLEDAVKKPIPTGEYAIITTSTPTGTLSFTGDFSSIHTTLAATTNPTFDSLTTVYSLKNGEFPTFNPRTGHFFNEYNDKRVYAIEVTANHPTQAIMSVEINGDRDSTSSALDAKINGTGRFMNATVNAGSTYDTLNHHTGISERFPILKINTNLPESETIDTRTTQRTYSLGTADISIDDRLAKINEGTIGAKTGAQQIKTNLEEFAEIMAMPGFDPTVTPTGSKSAYLAGFNRFTDGSTANNEIKSVRIQVGLSRYNLTLTMDTPSGTQMFSYVMDNTLAGRRKRDKLLNFFQADDVRGY
jgi:hypothetical protein